MVLLRLVRKLSSKMERKEEASGFIIYRLVDNTVQYLLMQTSYGIHHWTPPKGHVDPGENLREAAERETLEEAGLIRGDYEVDEGFCRVLKYLVKEKPKTVTYWLARVVNEKAQVRLSHEHQAFDWFALKEACEVAGFEDMNKMFVEAEQYLKGKHTLSAS